MRKLKNVINIELIIHVSSVKTLRNVKLTSFGCLKINAPRSNTVSMQGNASVVKISFDLLVYPLILIYLIFPLILNCVCFKLS